MNENCSIIFDENKEKLIIKNLRASQIFYIRDKKIEDKMFNEELREKEMKKKINEVKLKCQNKNH